MSEDRDTADQLKMRALRILVRREHSRAELARKLAPHAESPTVVEALLDNLLSKKQLSDERFAEGRARSLSRKYGATKILHDLKSKGISSELAAQATSQLNEFDRAREILQKKFPIRSQGREEQARRARFLQSRGFTYEVIRRALDGNSGSSD